MSYAYTIKLDRISGEVEQAGTWQANLMQILPSEEMRDLFREALISIGWQQEGDQIYTELDGIRCELGPNGSEIRAVLHQEIHVDQKVIGDSDDSPLLKEARIAEGKRKQTDKLERYKEEEMRKLTQRLLSIEDKVKNEIDLASHQVHAQALEIKAARLGQIKSSQSQVSEDGILEVTIHVSLN